jgi:RNA polymerase sigma-70 factor (ECF subfamily)
MKRLTDEEFDILINKYYNMLFVIAYKYTRDTFNSEDAVQDTFLKLYRAHKGFESEEHIKNWLIRVTINECINIVKKNRKILLIDQEYINNLPDTSDADEKNEEIRKCVMSLKDNYKNVIILFYYDNYTIREISNILKMSESNVKVTLNRARKKLKEEIIKRGIKDGKR